MSCFALGMPTLIELDDLEANIELCRKLGLSFVELNMNLPSYCPHTLAAEKLRCLRKETGIAFTLHLPEEIDLASFQPSIRKGHLDCCKTALAWAAQAGISIVNLHMNAGVYFSLPDHRVWLYEEYKEHFFDRLQNAFDELVELVNDKAITICIENGRFDLGFIREALEKLLSENRGRLALTWDVGHDAGSGFRHRPVFEELQRRIGHMHLHDWDGKKNHQVLFSGTVDIQAAFSLAKELDIAVVIETKTVESLTESVQQLRQRAIV